MSATISCMELRHQLDAGAPLLLIDIQVPELYACHHIPQAENVCVYEMVFLDRLAELAPDHGQPLVVYDESGTGRGAATARDKLLEAGYGKVSILAGGLAGWSANGYPVEVQGEQPHEPRLQDGTYRIDPEASVLEWTGRNINNRHIGRIPVRDGHITINDGSLRQGSVSLDMAGLTDLDLQDPNYRQMLEKHLKSDDFFDVARYPVATMLLLGWETIPGATPGTPDHQVLGQLTIKNVTRTISVPVTVAPQQDGSIKAQAAFGIDRTEWNVNYGSGRLFEKLGMHLVHDRIDIELFVLARPLD